MPTRILKVYIVALTGFSHVCRPGAPNNTLVPQVSFFENASHCMNGGQNVHFKDRGGRRSLQWPRSCLRDNQWSPFNDLLQQCLFARLGTDPKEAPFPTSQKILHLGRHRPGSRDAACLPPSLRWPSSLMALFTGWPGRD